jgi:hypothetical protein
MMQVKKMTIVVAAVACFGAAAYAAETKRITALDRALAKRAQVQAQYNPFTLERAEGAAAARSQAVVRVQGAVVRPPYRPQTRSPYQPPVRGPYQGAQ